ncbi:MAG: hypothetical protein AB7O24_12730 [Kofleriaceae bacterium]
MERSDRALAHARRAYERTHVVAGVRGVVIAAALVVLAIGLHRITEASWLIAGTLGASLAALGWRGGAWRRGAVAGVVAGLPPLIAPSIVFAVTQGGHCASCETSASLPCMIACFATSSLVGIAVGYRAIVEPMPRRFAIAAITTAALTGLLGCATTGFGGALGIVIGLVAGGVTGWVVAGRAAHA